jgi:hypothetical protein
MGRIVKKARLRESRHLKDLYGAKQTAILLCVADVRATNAIYTYLLQLSGALKKMGRVHFPVDM